MESRAHALSIAGTDPTGGAGLFADVRTFAAHGVHALAVPAVLTVQSTHGVARAEAVTADLLAAQLEAIDVPIHAVKTGALGSADNVRVVAASRFDVIVVDPVMLPTRGSALLDDDAIAALVSVLVPRATLVTPNLAEAARLAGRPVANVREMEDAARAIVDLGAHAVLVKGGHLEGDAIDVFALEGRIEHLRAPRIASDAHGTGCALSASIAARLARGEALFAATIGAKEWLGGAIARSVAFGATRVLDLSRRG